MTFTEIEPASTYVHFSSKKRGTLFPSTNFVAILMSSMKFSQTNKYIIACKTFIENQAEIIVFLFKISNTERNLLSVKSIDLVDSYLSLAHLPRVP